VWCVCVRAYRTSVRLQAEPVHKICKLADSVHQQSVIWRSHFILSRDCSLKSGRQRFCWPMPLSLHCSGLLRPALKVCVFVSIYVCVCVCVCIYIYIYIHTHTHIQDAAERTPLFEKRINSKPKKTRQMFFYFWKAHRMPFYINVF